MMNILNKTIFTTFYLLLAVLMASVAPSSTRGLSKEVFQTGFRLTIIYSDKLFNMIERDVQTSGLVQTNHTNKPETVKKNFHRSIEYYPRRQENPGIIMAIGHLPVVKITIVRIRTKVIPGGDIVIITNGLDPPSGVLKC